MERDKVVVKSLKVKKAQRVEVIFVINSCMISIMKYLL